MPDNYRLQLRPKARAEATITGDCWRFTVLTNALIRMEYQPEGLLRTRRHRPSFAGTSRRRTSSH